MPAAFDHEKPDVYQLELQFVTWVTELLQELRKEAGPTIREECDHLNRGSLSSLFNTAEGNGKRRRQVRVRFFDDAPGSATECAACLDALVAKGVCTRRRVREGKVLLFRVVSMLTKLMQRCSDDGVVRESEEEYEVNPLVRASNRQEREGTTEDENEDEDENERAE